MSETNPTPYYDDEISISELLMKLWAKRGIIVMLPLVLAGLTLVALLMGKTTAGNTLSFYVELNGITLTSDQSRSANGSGSGSMTGAAMNDISQPETTVSTRYPNGMLFSPQDLVNPSVLRALADQYGVSSEGLAQHIDVQFGTPISNGVLAEYKAALSANSKGSAQDLAALNARYEDKLSAAAKRGLKITVNFVNLEISREQASEIAASLPRQWNRVYTEQFNTRIPSEISNLRWTDTVFDLSSTLGLQEADIQLQMLQKGTELLSDDSRLRGLKNERSTSAADLSGYIDDFRSIFFEPLYLGAFATASPLSRVYERDIRRQIDELDNEIAELDARLSDIRNFQAGAQGGSSTSASDGTQLDGSALTAVVNLAEQAALSAYLQESLDLRYTLIQDKVALNTKLARLTSGEVTGEDAVSEDFRELATARYTNIVSSYSELLSTAQTMLKNATPSYYAVITQPSTDGKLIDKRDFLFLALALALGGMLAIIAALVWPQKQ